MIKGFLQSNTPMTWIPDPQWTGSRNNSFIRNISNLDLSSLQLSVYRCLYCNRMEIAYSQTITAQRTCSKCGATSRETNKFCIKCRQRIESESKKASKSKFHCPNCKNPVDIDDVTCPNCGTDLDRFMSDILNTCFECGYSDPSLEDLVECPRCGAILPI